MHKFDFDNLKSLNSKIDYINNSVNYLKSFDLSQIIDINLTLNLKVVTLFKNHKIYLNNELVCENVENIIEDTYYNIYAITFDKKIIPIDSYNEVSWYMNNLDYKYKKIIFYKNIDILDSIFYFIALDKLGNIFISYSDIRNIAIIPSNFKNVDDIFMDENKEIPYIKKGNNILPLYLIQD